MNSGIARKSAVSHWLLTFMIGLIVLTSVIGLCCYQLAHQAQQRAEEVRPAVLRAEAEARRVQADQRAAKIKSAERVGQLYREIENLSQFGDQVQTSFQRRPRLLKSSEPQSQPVP